MAKKRPRGRPINGILLLDKPLGLSSNQALQTVKNIYFAQKAGHTGSLDPLATGMLPLCFGEATKFSQFLLEADKEYVVKAQLGVRTSTCDSEGEVIAEKDATAVSLAMVTAALEKFRGPIQQIPSMFSALKHKGQPLYKLARQGIEVERKPRDITIYELELLDFQNCELSLRVKCSKGTYIRNLVDDIGEVLGCGGHVVELHRTHVGAFKSEQMISLESLETLRQGEQFAELDALILPLEAISLELPRLELTNAAAFQLQQGQMVDGMSLPDAPLVQLFHQQRFIGIGACTAGELVAKRLINLNNPQD